MNLIVPWMNRETYRFINTLTGNPARRMTDFDPKITFDDVGGLAHARASLHEVVDFLASPGKYRSLGARIPKHILLTGPPGCGKTLLARAVLGVCGVPAFRAWGSDYGLIWIGVGAARLRNTFRTARMNKPALILIDDIDAFARSRTVGAPSEGELELNFTLQQLMKEMDDRHSAGVILLATTNRMDLLDPALLQPHRFERILEVGEPDERERREIFDIHLRETPLDEGINSVTLARLTAGFTGADIYRLVNEAALLAARDERGTIGMSEFEAVLARVAGG